MRLHDIISRPLWLTVHGGSYNCLHKKALVNAGLWATCLLSSTNECRKRYFHIVGTPFLSFYAAFSPEERSLVGGPDY